MLDPPASDSLIETDVGRPLMTGNALATIVIVAVPDVDPHASAHVIVRA